MILACMQIRRDISNEVIDTLLNYEFENRQAFEDFVQSANKQLVTEHLHVLSTVEL
jgi:CRISPR/Cas system endoribonuclease Cas6 (RAMP superfamily)